MQQQRSSHFGVYGLICRDGQVLLVRKTRGAYTGLLDLPGGSPDPSDPDRTATLRRELAEETGLLLTGHGPWYGFELSVTRDSSGREIDLVHSGRWAAATVETPAA